MSMTKFYVNPPVNSVVGTLPDQASADQLLENLVSTNYPKDQIVVNSGKKGLDFIDPDGTAHGLITQLTRSFQKFSTGVEDRLLSATKQALLDGKFIVAVPTDGSEAQILQVQQLISEQGGNEILFYGHTTYRLLEGW